MGAPLHQRLSAAPVLSDRKAALKRVADLRGDCGAAQHAAALLDEPRVRALLAGLADHSPFLWQLASRDAPRLLRLLASEPGAHFDALLARLTADCAAMSDVGAVMRALRRARAEVALLIALCDIGGLWALEDVTSRLTRFADAAVSAALDFALREAHDAGRLKLAARARAQRDCGITVLALGKHGAGELNYSSDIDLIVFYDAGAPAFLDPDAAAQTAVRLTKALVRILQERTPDGYVARVDLRLRPDPGATAVAVSLAAALSYYETLGQNWERAAMIKARPVAGDIPLGENFLRELAPFIWRRYFDYAAIADVHAMKRQIHALRGHDEVTVPGHDVKLGRGGIREIEFFVQTQQLIFGGRRPQLRGRGTLAMLAELSRDGWVAPEAVAKLSAAYRVLRRTEHRLQMVNDEQTQRLPSDTDALEKFARFCGARRLAQFSAALTREFRTVEAHYGRLFEHAPGLHLDAGSLVFTGVSDDPDTLKTIARMGFKRPAEVTETVRGWHFGRRAAVRSPRAREVLTELVPGLLDAFAGSGDPDAALAAFDGALAKMPAAVELFSLLKSNGSLRRLFADILGSAPRLADIVTQRPHVLDAAIDPGLLTASGRGAAIARRITEHLPETLDTELFLNRSQDIAVEEKFLISVRLLSGVIDPSAAAREFSALAEHLVKAAFAHAGREFSREAGTLEGGACAVVAMGKLGSHELTAASDLDLILLYDFDPARPESRGRRPLHATQYFTRLTQRLVSLLTAPTRNGRLYEVDLRLRPSGGKGPLATQIAGFAAYQREEAETWEHMALTRARVIAGPPALAARAEAVISGTLRLARDPRRTRRDITEMRALIAREKGDDDAADLKLVAGGLIDVEFIAQFLVLRHAHGHPGILRTSTRDVFEAARALSLLSQGDADQATGAHRLLADVIQMTQLVFGGAPGAALPAEAARRVAVCVGLPDARSLAAALADCRANVREIFTRLIG